MQSKQFYNKDTKVSSRKSATTFGELPDCLVNGCHDVCETSIDLFNMMLRYTGIGLHQSSYS